MKAETVDRGIWYQIRVGGFSSYVEARDFGEKLKGQSLIDNFTITRANRADH